MKMSVSEIRQKYLRTFEQHDHRIIPSASLLPENDPSTLFTGSGMQPMVVYLLGEPHPMGKRLADSQTCFRSQDIDEVGDNRHTTFFEMLGNWSLGDYFKEEQISWMFAFLTDVIGLDPHRLYVTVFAGNEALQIGKDEAAVECWKKMFATKGIVAEDVDHSSRDGMGEGRIFYFDEKKNWWSRAGVTANMPIGEPGGPDSEVFWDLGKERFFHENSPYRDQPCHVNCDCGRFLEIGNNVFMQYQKTAQGFEPLPNKNVDFGGGLERMAAAQMDTPDVFLIDVFDKGRSALEQLTAKTYHSNGENTKAFRVILDHLRGVTFLIADGAVPSNKDQGYFTRRLTRRSIRFGKQLGITKPFCAELVSCFIDVYKEAYPHLAQKSETIIQAVKQEEEKFSKTLVSGEKELEKIFTTRGSLSGQDAFLLYSTYGFPLELTEEIAIEKGQKVDREVFQAEFKKHQELSRSGAAEKFAGGLQDHSTLTVRLHTATHMLHQALREVLGDHVFQRGSNITQSRLRFDFSHPEKLSQIQLKQVEDIVNDHIKQKLDVHFEILTLDDAKQKGAIGLFEDKYAQLGGKLKVYFIGDQALDTYFSREVCGGPHVNNTSELGHFTITKEESIGAGLRRIKAEIT